MAENDDNLDYVVNDEKNKSTQTNGNAAVDAGKEFAKKKLIEKLSEHKVVQAVKKAFSSIVTKLTPYLIPIIVVVIIIFCCIGFVGFFINMPGLVIGNLHQMFEEVEDAINEILNGDNNNLSGDGIDKQKRIELLQYIYDMGIDVVGYGFVPDVTFESDKDKYIINEDNEFEVNDDNKYSSEDGKYKIKNYSTVYRGKLEEDNSEVVDPKEDLIFFYLMANERAYTRNDGGILGIFNIAKTNWTGMINIKGDFGPNGIEANIDRENKVLKISANNAHMDELLNEDQYSFPLDGWTGRYGIPIEFSLALHLATMSSGMVEELLTNENLQTEVTIALEETKNCNINFEIRVKDENGNVNSLKYKPESGEIRDLSEKIAAGEKITLNDLSIQGLYYAYVNFNSYDYIVINADQLEEGELFQNYRQAQKNISNHLETIDAILGSNKIAVQTSRINSTNGEPYDYKDYYDYEKFTHLEDAGDIRAVSGLTNGAYICQYNENNEPDENTGQLRRCMVDEQGKYTLYYEEDKKEENEEYYVYKLVSEHSKDNGETSDNTYEIYIPKNTEEIEVLRYSDIAVIKQIEGLKNIIIEGADKFDKTRYDSLNNDGYRSIFEEIDWFIILTKNINGWDDENTEEKLKYDKVTKDLVNFYGYENESMAGDFSYISYYCKKYEDAMKAGEQGDYVATYNALKKLYFELDHDYEIIKNRSNSTKDLISEQLKQLGCSGLTLEIVKYIHNQFAKSADVDNTDVNYVQPYITSVKKHWYKDVDFSNAYQGNSNEPIELPYKGDSELPDNIEVVTIITPTGDGVPKQTEQPYVIKGDLVLCDGEVQENAKLSDVNDDNYEWGDGYRTTKKILTQGYYYTYDGTAETAQSIYFQEKIEDGLRNAMYKINVVDGRIVFAQKVDGDSVTVPVKGEKLKKSDIIDEDGNFREDFTSKVGDPVYKEGRITVYFTQENPKASDKNKIVKHYIIYGKGRYNSSNEILITSKWIQ